MRYILDLSLIPAEDGPWYSAYSSFRSIARGRGIDIRWISIKEPSSIPEGLIEREIESASAYILRLPAFLMDDADYLPEIVERITSGLPLVCFLDRNHYDHQNKFLEPYGIEGTMLGLFALPHSENADHPRDILLSRSDYPSAFRDPRLFNHVDELRLDFTQAIRLHGNAQSLLALPSGTGFSVDTKTDLPQDWPTTDYTCISGYLGRGSDQSKILVLSTDLIHDKYVDMSGYTHLGIEGADNKTFAENLLSMLVDKEPPPTQSIMSTAYSLIEQIERNYYDVTRSVLSRECDNWWSLVPDRIRVACAEKKKSEPHSMINDSAYMDLLDYQRIWRVHWIKFQPFLANSGLDGGKNKALSYFSKLNEVRKLIAHPTKTHAGKIELGRSEMDLLKRESQRSIVLWGMTNELEVM